MNRVMNELIEEISRGKHHSFDYMDIHNARKVIIADMYARPKKIKRLFLKSVNCLFHLVHIVYKIQQSNCLWRIIARATSLALGRESLLNFKTSRVTFLVKGNSGPEKLTVIFGSWCAIAYPRPTLSNFACTRNTLERPVVLSSIELDIIPF